MATKVPLDNILSAIEGSNGNVSIIARKLKVSRPTVYKYLKQFTTAQEAYDDERYKLADALESAILREALGEVDKFTGQYTRVPNLTALIFVCKSHPEMRRRGWREGADVRVRMDNVDFSKLSDEELEAIARGEG